MHGTRGFSLVELMLALALTLVVSAGVFAVIRAAHDAALAEPEIGDLQQRLRVASDAIFSDLLLAGAPAAGATVHSLNRTIAVVLPFRTGPVRPDPPGTFKSDTVTVIYAPAKGWQTTTAQALTPGSSSVIVNAPVGCPLNGSLRDPACGFTPEVPVLVFDHTGANDYFVVSAVTGNILVLQHSGVGLVHTYPAGSAIVQAKRVTYYLKAGSAQLMRYNGIASDAPVVDNVVGLQFEYFGSAPSDGDSLVPLLPAELTDGPWRPDAVDANRFDADLLRIRRVAVRLHLRPAASVPGVRDREISFDVSPRGLNGVP